MTFAPSSRCSCPSCPPVIFSIIIFHALKEKQCSAQAMERKSFFVLVQQNLAECLTEIQRKRSCECHLVARHVLPHLSWYTSTPSTHLFWLWSTCLRVLLQWSFFFLKLCFKCRLSDSLPKKNLNLYPTHFPRFNIVAPCYFDNFSPWKSLLLLLHLDSQIILIPSYTFFTILCTGISFLA